MARLRRGKVRTQKAKKWMFGEYVCGPCDVRVRERDRKAHNEFHAAQTMVLGQQGKRENVIAKKEREERQRRQSRTVAQEQKRRGNPKPAPDVPEPITKESAAQRAQRSWAEQLNHRSQVMAGTAPPQNQQQKVAATGPAGYIQAAARMLIDFQPLSHTEQKELAMSLNVAMGDLAKAVEAYQENRVRERFHPNCMRPLDLVSAAIMECRAGWVQMILAIERHYAAHFEAARQGGPIPGQTKGTTTYFDEAAG